jgi:RimJ/RimL family protein N-acetyltransferase
MTTLSNVQTQITNTTADTPILSAECDEPEGKTTRHVYPMVFTPENLRTFWEKARVHRTLFSSEIRDDYKSFINLILRQGRDGSIEATGLFWVVDDFVGIFYMTDIRPESDALVHYSFFDGRHRGRIGLVKQMMKYVFDEYNFRRLTVEIPLYATEKTHNFVHKSLGFKKEGRKRKAALFDNEYFDTNIYGILKEEVT